MASPSDSTYNVASIASACASTQSASCATGSFYSAAASTTADRTCTACPAGTFSAASSASTFGTAVQTTCASTQSASCAAGSYYSAASTATADRTCAPCAAGTFSAAPTASTFASTVLAACPACSAACPPFYGFFTKVECSATTDRLCSGCPAGSFTDVPTRLSCTCTGAAPGYTPFTTPMYDANNVVTGCCQANSAFNGTSGQCQCLAGYAQTTSGSNLTCAARARAARGRCPRRP